MEWDDTTGEDAAAPPRDGGADRSQFAALLGALREQWDGMDADEQAFLVYCLQRLRVQVQVRRSGDDTKMAGATQT
jgi:hypothetical protein